MLQVIYIILLALATIGFWWVALSVLKLLNQLLTWLGSWVHDFLDLPQAEEKDAWLFALLVGITRYPTAAFACGTLFFSVLSYITEPHWAIIARAMFVAAFLVLFVVRMVGVVMGSVIFGTTMRTIINSLQT